MRRKVLEVFFIMYFDYLLLPLPPLYELARPDKEGTRS